MNVIVKMKLSFSFEIKKYLVNNWNSQLVILVTVGDCENWPYLDFVKSVFSCRKTGNTDAFWTRFT